MDPLRAEPCSQLSGSLVCIHSNSSRRLACTMEACGFGSSDVNPYLQRTRQVAYCNCRLIWLGYAIGERDALCVLEAISEHPRQHAFCRFRWMACDAQAQRLVDTAIGVSQLDVKYVDRVAECHGLLTYL